MKTVAEGVMDLSLLMANASQLKFVVNKGQNGKFYIALLVFIPLVLVLQIISGMLLCILVFTKADSEKEKKRATVLNTTTVGLIVIITALSAIISTLGFSE